MAGIEPACFALSFFCIVKCLTLHVSPTHMWHLCWPYLGVTIGSL